MKIIRRVLLASIAIAGLMGCASSTNTRGTGAGGYVSPGSDFGTGGTTNADGGITYGGTTGVGPKTKSVRPSGSDYNNPNSPNYNNPNSPNYNPDYNR